MFSGLIQKYNVPGPRYTSYPTVPYWDEKGFSTDIWKQHLIKSFTESNAQEGISVYIHLPFCESLCTFCGCNKRITRQHHVEAPYIEALLKEWELYCNLFPEKPIIKELHLGGGTPTFFSVEHLEQLIHGIFLKAERAESPEYSFEGHPNNTTKAQLQQLFNLGFNRVSFGVQDYNEKVQIAIHRIQPFENVERVTNWAREIGYQSIGHDLIFGLPFQTLEDILFTINKTNELYRNQGLGLIQKIPTPITPIKIDKDSRHITLAYFDQKSTVDYIGVIQGIPVCFDAKECHNNTFPLQNIHQHQMDFMQDFENQDGIAFFLLYYTQTNQYYYLTYQLAKQFFQRMDAGGRKSFRQEELQEEYFFSQEANQIVPYLELLQRDLDDRNEDIDS